MHGRMGQAMLLQDVLAQALRLVLVILVQVVGKQAAIGFPFEAASQRNSS